MKLLKLNLGRLHFELAIIPRDMWIGLYVSQEWEFYFGFPPMLIFKFWMAPPKPFIMVNGYKAKVISIDQHKGVAYLADERGRHMVGNLRTGAIHVESTQVDDKTVITRVNITSEDIKDAVPPSDPE